mmetsp:Transcript_2874/g.6445  ORF Transcript_2874/g.6445 Transcript_2874/m.6445 type:complete len:226 (+) Transcript_2874:1554-2231(+)
MPHGHLDDRRAFQGADHAGAQARGEQVLHRPRAGVPGYPPRALLHGPHGLCALRRQERHPNGNCRGSVGSRRQDPLHSDPHGRHRAEGLRAGVDHDSDHAFRRSRARVPPRPPQPLAQPCHPVGRVEPRDHPPREEGHRHPVRLPPVPGQDLFSAAAGRGRPKERGPRAEVHSIPKADGDDAPGWRENARQLVLASLRLVPGPPRRDLPAGQPPRAPHGGDAESG